MDDLHLQRRLEELIQAGAHQARPMDPAVVQRRGQRRRRGIAAGVVLGLVVVLAGAVALRQARQEVEPTATTAGQPTTTSLPPPALERLSMPGERLVTTPVVIAQGQTVHGTWRVIALRADDAPLPGHPRGGPRLCFGHEEFKNGQPAGFGRYCEHASIKMEVWSYGWLTRPGLQLIAGRAPRGTTSVRLAFEGGRSVPARLLSDPNPRDGFFLAWVAQQAKLRSARAVDAKGRVVCWPNPGQPCRR